jgi:tetratricopeptide (TPR) repeat protein
MPTQGGNIMVRRLIMLLLIALMVYPVYAQQDNLPDELPPTPTVDIEALAARVETALEDIQEIEGRTNYLMCLALDMFGLFEGLSAVFGIALPIIVAIAGIFGFSRLESTRGALNEAKKKLEEEVQEQRKESEVARQELKAMQYDLEKDLKDKRDELEVIRQTFEVAIDEQRRISTDASIALGLLTVGRNQYRAKDNTGAIETFERALEVDPRNPVILYNLGYVLTQSDRFNEALESLQKALDLNPSFVPAKAALGYVYRRMGDEVDKAIRHLTNQPKPDETFPTELEVLQKMNQLSILQVHFPETPAKDEAEKAERVSRLNDEFGRLYNKSESYFFEALQELPKLIDEDGESWQGALGGLYRRRGMIKDAIIAYEKGTRVTPKSSYPFSNLAMLYAQEHRIDDMERMFRRVEQLALSEVQADVDNNWAFNDLVTSRLALGKAKEANDALEEALHIASKDSPYALKSLTDTLERLLKFLPEARHEAIHSILNRIKAFEIDRANHQNGEIA